MVNVTCVRVYLLGEIVLNAFGAFADDGGQRVYALPCIGNNVRKHEPPPTHPESFLYTAVQYARTVHAHNYENLRGKRQTRITMYIYCVYVSIYAGSPVDYLYIL